MRKPVLSKSLRRLSARCHRKRAERKYVRRLLSPPGEALEEQRGRQFERKICFSIAVPLYNTPKNYLEEMIASCQNQTYADWELCLADGSDREHAYVGETVRRMAAVDPRIKYQALEQNGGISENTNAALQLAAGDYIALLDHDDLLHPSALYEYMQVICEEGADFLYCDEMIFAGRLSRIVSLHFKPDFSVDNLRANNYICHFSVFSRELLQRAGMFRKEYDGSQDHDMILRLTEKAEKIVHVPEVLYFWRSHPDSVAAGDISPKAYAADAGRRAVLSHLRRCGLEGKVESSRACPTVYQITYRLAARERISVIISAGDSASSLPHCIHSIREKTAYDDYEILVVGEDTDQEFADRSGMAWHGDSRIRMLRFSEESAPTRRLNNAAAEASGKYVLFLDSAVEIITPGWMEEMLMYAQREDVGAVGAKLYYPDDTVEHAGIVLGMGAYRCAGRPHHRYARDSVGYFGRLCYAQEFTAVSAACLLVSRGKFQSVGGFDEDFSVACGGVDLCLSLRRAGYRNIWTPRAEAYRHVSVSGGHGVGRERQEELQRERRLFREKWQREIDAGDPCYNRNLTLDRPDFSPRLGRHLAGRRWPAQGDSR